MTNLSEALKMQSKEELMEAWNVSQHEMIKFVNVGTLQGGRNLVKRTLCTSCSLATQTHEFSCGHKVCHGCANSRCKCGVCNRLVVGKPLPLSHEANSVFNMADGVSQLKTGALGHKAEEETQVQQEDDSDAPYTKQELFDVEKDMDVPMCKSCRAHPLAVELGCGHQVCLQCSNMLGVCTICRKIIFSRTSMANKYRSSLDYIIRERHQSIGVNTPIQLIPLDTSTADSEVLDTSYNSSSGTVSNTTSNETDDDFSTDSDTTFAVPTRKNVDIPTKTISSSWGITTPSKASTSSTPSPSKSSWLTKFLMSAGASEDANCQNCLTRVPKFVLQCSRGCKVQTCGACIVNTCRTCQSDIERLLPIEDSTPVADTATAQPQPVQDTTSSPLSTKTCGACHRRASNVVMCENNCRVAACKKCLFDMQQRPKQFQQCAKCDCQVTKIVGLRKSRSKNGAKQRAKSATSRCQECTMRIGEVDLVCGVNGCKHSLCKRCSQLSRVCCDQVMSANAVSLTLRSSSSSMCESSSENETATVKLSPKGSVRSLPNRGGTHASSTMTSKRSPSPNGQSTPKTSPTSSPTRTSSSSSKRTLSVSPKRTPLVSPSMLLSSPKRPSSSSSKRHTSASPKRPFSLSNRHTSASPKRTPSLSPKRNTSASPNRNTSASPKAKTSPTRPPWSSSSRTPSLSPKRIGKFVTPPRQSTTSATNNANQSTSVLSPRPDSTTPLAKISQKNLHNGYDTTLVRTLF
eukprot:m.34701 g.34701  ORF g.34701 m.34701 type:complete len:745 (+) comp17021_c0_seq1:376-2610(+)